jgi:predicted nucleotidyltransferase
MPMMQARIDIPLEKIKALCRRYQVRRLELFGSVLSDDFDADSDIDVLVEFEPEAKIGLIAFNRMRYELSELWQRPVDLVPRAGLKSAIRDAVLAQAEIIYAQ